jgi:hypothetical protein
MKLSPHFNLDEFTRSDYATRHGIDNTPPGFVLSNLRVLATRLERVRLVLGAPLFITSGYRCPELNRAIGGSLTSAHVGGLAADFIAPEYGSPFAVARAIEANGDEIDFDQLIYEGKWVHVGFTQLTQPRREVLTATFAGGKVKYSEGLRG